MLPCLALPAPFALVRIQCIYAALLWVLTAPSRLNHLSPTAYFPLPLLHQLVTTPHARLVSLLARKYRGSCQG